jgi:hypothetical protein
MAERERLEWPWTASSIDKMTGLTSPQEGSCQALWCEGVQGTACCGRDRPAKQSSAAGRLQPSDVSHWGIWCSCRGGPKL